MRYKSLIALLFISMLKLSAQHTAPAFSYLDVYELEYASDPQICSLRRLYCLQKNGI